MKPKINLLVRTALAATIIGLFGYVKYQWPAKVEELAIPAGRVAKIPGTEIKGICITETNGLSIWCRVTPAKLKLENDAH